MKKRLGIFAISVAVIAPIVLFITSTKDDVGRTTTKVVSVSPPRDGRHEEETQRTEGLTGQEEASISQVAFYSPSGHRFNIAGSRDVADFINSLSPQARTGNAAAAYEVYQAEAMCASLYATKNNLKSMTGLGEDEKSQKLEDLKVSEDACKNVTPAQMQERFTFLDTAIRAGNAQAIYDYRAEGPMGLPLSAFDPKDTRVTEWKTNSVDLLTGLANKGDRVAWTLLSTDYATGIVTARNYSQALTYETALLATGRNPAADPLMNPYINSLASQLNAVQVQQAIEAGKALALQNAQRYKRG